ncbi:MAG: acyl-CoA dehydrogenase [Wenzhouxiangellaceae bacterium]
MTGLLLIALLLTALSAAHLSWSLRTWTIASAVLIIASGLFGLTPWASTLIIGALFAVIAVPLNVTQIRQQYLTLPILKLYRQLLPQLSDTEQVALDAGTVGWEGELFSGKPRWHKLLRKKTPELSLEEREFLDGPTEALCDMVDAWDISHHRADLPPEIWQHLKTHGFFGLIIPKEYGGHGFSALAHRAILQKIAGTSAEVSSAVAVPNSLGPAELLLHYGTDEQKQHYLPRLAKGQEIPCFALTGPNAGSDATSIPDYGVVCKGQWHGKEVLGVRLNFDKRYITLAPVATVIGLAFRLYDPDELIGDTEDIGITLALIPRETEGIEVGNRHLPLNVPFQNGPVRGKDVFVPLDYLIGGTNMVGQGWRMLVECLSVGRAISLPSTSTGAAKLVALATGAYARIRKQFNIPIGRFEGVEEALARIGGLTYAASAVSKMTAVAVDQGEKPSVPSAIAKYHATDIARTVISDSMDIHGGKGIIMGPNNYLGRAWQGAPIWITVEGANILTRSMMIFGQGAIRCHPFVLKEMAAANLNDPQQRLQRFDEVLWQHIGLSIGNAVRSLVMGLSFSRFAAVPGDRRTRKYYRKLSRYSAAFGFIADVSMLTFGGKLKQKEYISARLGDVLSHLYICSAMLKRFEDQGRPAADQAVLSWAFHHSIYRMQEALRGVIDNFPSPLMRLALGAIIFPFGKRERLPNDRLTHKVAQILITPSETRDRLTDGVYRKNREGYVIGFMEDLLPRVIAAEPLERKLLKALKQGELSGYTPEEQLADAVRQGVLTETEAEQVRRTRDDVFKVISVDDFPSEELRAGHRSDSDASLTSSDRHAA